MLVTSAIVVGTASANPVDKVVAAHYAPLMIEGDDTRPGYAVEVIKEAARRADRTIELSFLPFPRAMLTVQNDPATIMPALYYGEKRKDSFLWLAEIQSAKLSFVTNDKSIDSIQSARSLSSIVVEEGSTSDNMLTQLGFKSLLRVSTAESSARMLAANRVNAWFQSRRIIEQTWHRLKLEGNLKLGDVLHEIPIYLVASPTLPEEIKTAYQRAIESMRSDGTLDSLWNKYDLE